jgi:cytochrome c oxidase subunit II
MGMVGIVVITLVLLGVIVVQIGKLIELSAAIRGEEEARLEANNTTGLLLAGFGVVFLLGTVYSAWFYKDWLLGYGIGLVGASEHGDLLDQAFNITLIFTGTVFIITHIALFYYSWKYRETKNSKAEFIPHNNRLEVIWTVIPAVVMTFLVVNGLDTWNKVMGDIGADEVSGKDYIEIEGNGYQWAWQIRYPGNDGLLGETNFRLINLENNPFGQNWEDPKGLDDFYPNEIVLPKGKKVRVRITARDVLHNFYLPHFRLKMDAVPGLPTYFVFTPKYTTEEYRMLLKDNPNYQLPSNPKDPTSAPRWQNFEYELACAELCGSGHYSMKKIVRIVTDSEYNAWLKEQQSYYDLNVKNKAGDPFIGTHVEVEQDTTQTKQDTTQTE